MGQQENRPKRTERKGGKGGADVRSILSSRQMPQLDRLFLTDAFERISDYREIAAEMREGDTSYQGLGMVFDPGYRRAIDTWTRRTINQRLTTSQADNDLLGLTQKTYGQRDQWMTDALKQVIPGSMSSLEVEDVLRDVLTGSPTQRGRRGGMEAQPATPERQLADILLDLNEQTVSIATSANDNGSLGNLDAAHFARVQTAVHGALRAAEASGSQDIRDALLSIALFSSEPVKDTEYYKADDVNTVMGNVRALFAIYGDTYVSRMEEHLHDVAPTSMDAARLGAEFAGLPLTLLGVRVAEGSTVMLPTNFSTMVQRGLVPGASAEMRQFLIQQQVANFMEIGGVDRYMSLTDAQGGHPYERLQASYAVPDVVANLFLLDANLYSHGEISEEQLREGLQALQVANMAGTLRERTTALKTLHLVEQIGDDISVYAFASAVPAKGKGEAVIDFLVKKGDVVGMISVVENGKSSGLPVELPTMPTGFLLRSMRLLHEQLAQPLVLPKREPQYAQTGARRGLGIPSGPSERQRAAMATTATVDVARLYDKKAGLTPVQRQRIAKLLEHGISSSRVRTRIVGEGSKAHEESYIEIEGFDVTLQPINTTAYKAVTAKELPIPEE